MEVREGDMAKPMRLESLGIEGERIQEKWEEQKGWVSWIHFEFDENGWIFLGFVTTFVLLRLMLVLSGTGITLKIFQWY